VIRGCDQVAHLTAGARNHNSVTQANLAGFGSRPAPAPLVADDPEPGAGQFERGVGAYGRRGLFTRVGECAEHGGL
jgi:hypothetical protein